MVEGEDHVIVYLTLITAVQRADERFEEMPGKRDLAYHLNELRHRRERYEEAGDLKKRPADERSGHNAGQELFRVDDRHEESKHIAQQPGKEENQQKLQYLFEAGRFGGKVEVRGGVQERVNEGKQSIHG